MGSTPFLDLRGRRGAPLDGSTSRRPAGPLVPSEASARSQGRAGTAACCRSRTARSLVWPGASRHADADQEQSAPAAGAVWRTPNRSPFERDRGGCSRMETGDYVRCFGIVAGESRHSYGFESHPPHRASPGRIVLAWGYVFPGTVCGACTPTADPGVGRWSTSVCCPAGERVPRRQRVDGRTSAVARDAPESWVPHPERQRRPRPVSGAASAASESDSSESTYAAGALPWMRRVRPCPRCWGITADTVPAVGVGWSGQISGSYRREGK